MKKTKENKLKKDNSTNSGNDDQKFPASQFNKDQRKDAEKALSANKPGKLKDHSKDSE